VDLCRTGSHWKLLNQGAEYASFRTRERANVKLTGRLGSQSIQPQSFYRVSGSLQYTVEDVLHMLTDTQYKSIYDNNLCTAAQLDYIPSYSLDTKPCK
jgi:hypothetical protein